MFARGVLNNFLDFVVDNSEEEAMMPVEFPDIEASIHAQNSGGNSLLPNLEAWTSQQTPLPRSHGEQVALCR